MTLMISESAFSGEAAAQLDALERRLMRAQKGDYFIKYLPGASDRFHVYRPGADAPSFMAATEAEANLLISTDRAQSSPLIRCVGCVEEACPCLPQ